MASVAGTASDTSVVSILALLDALQPLNLLDAFDFRVLVTTDGEEQAEASEAMTQKIAKGAELALIFEPATRDGALVTGRSGAGRFELQVTGRSAHAGDNVTAGRNAILELAHKIPQIDALTNPRSGVVANCAVIEGGTRAHVVPDRAGLVIDVRCRQASDANAIRERLTAIAADSMLEGCSTELSGRIGRPPWQAGDASRVLFDIWRSAAHTLRVPELKDTTAGSPSGANLLAPTGIAILDGLGPIAGDTHQTGEWLKLSSLPERTALNALALVTWLHQRAQGIWRARS